MNDKEHDGQEPVMSGAGADRNESNRDRTYSIGKEKSAGLPHQARAGARRKRALPDARNGLLEALEEACSYISAQMCILLLYSDDVGENAEEIQRLRQSCTVGMSIGQALGFEKAANSMPSSAYLARLSSPVSLALPGTLVSDSTERNGPSSLREFIPLRDWAASAGISSLALAPLASGGENRGLIAFCAAPGRHFNKRDIGTLRFISKMVSLAMAISRQKSKDRFMNALSHELRTPLTSIIGFTQIIRKRINSAVERDERLISQIDVLWSQAHRLSRLIDTFVDVSRLESGQFSINPDRVEIVALLKKATEQSLAQSRSRHQIAFELPEHEVAVVADAKRLDQVFSQILSNALRFSPEHEPIRVRCEDMAGEAKVVVSITDRGPGVAASKKKAIFERFAASDPLRAGGLGVGLYLSKSIVEAHGGTMSLESLPTRGTTIRIELPK